MAWEGKKQWDGADEATAGLHRGNSYIPSCARDKNKEKRAVAKVKQHSTIEPHPNKVQGRPRAFMVPKAEKRALLRTLRFTIPCHLRTTLSCKNFFLAPTVSALLGQKVFAGQNGSKDSCEANGALTAA
ncbi:Ferric reductase transmembrane component 3 [Fusarium oxysporum f. sp. albedinis]|nr:Ferric reductase transmembrane component 3 [Fusarium oxysporum f. sp. albedinis]